MIFFEYHAFIDAQDGRNPLSQIVEQFINVSGFGDNVLFTLGYINLYLAVGPYEQPRVFILLQLVPRVTYCMGDLEPYTQGCALHVSPMPQGYLEEQESICECSKSPFQRDKAYFSKQLSLLN